jgi:glutamyl-tRNA reductase
MDIRRPREIPKCHSQVSSVDFDEIYATVGRTTSLRIHLAIAASATLDCEINQQMSKGRTSMASLM